MDYVDDSRGYLHAGIYSICRHVLISGIQKTPM